MARKTVREIEAELVGRVEDGVLDRLGYREVEVRLPGGDIVVPPPEAHEMTAGQQRQKFSEQVLAELSGSYRPATIWKVGIPRTYTPQQVRTEGVWVVQPSGEPAVACYPLTIEKQDARWYVYLTPQRRTGLMSN